jgi:2-polyprenyl-3-methyl-5-hydroxy-6-metoxy-1,4-benzoquinol methylase
MKQEEIFREKNVAQVREYWNSRPCNIRHSPQPVGSREYFDEVEARKYFVEPHIPGFAEFPRWAGKRVLEIGCGIGTDTINFARAGARVTAVDLSEKSLELARRRADVFGLSDRIDFRAADAEILSEAIRPEPYDLVYSFGVIHHTPNPERVVEQVRRNFVHANSEFKVMIYHRRSWKAFWILLAEGKGAFWRLDELVARNSEAQTGCPVTYTYTPASAKTLLRGFQIDSMFVDHIFPYRIQDYVKYRYVKNWYFRILPRAIFRGMERRFGWHLCITARPEPA